MHTTCSICLGRGRVHLPKCRIFVDPDATCSCGNRPCPACEGSGQWPQRRADDYATLMERCIRLLRAPLDQADLEYVQDLMSRVECGMTPLLVDWFRSRELVAKYRPS